MKTCKVKPDKSTCSACLATQEMFDVVDDCSECVLNTMRYELVSVAPGLFGRGYAFVFANGGIGQVALDRVYDVREEK